MVRKIVWSARSQKDRISILEYWKVRNLSNKYARKLNTFIKETLKIISKYPGIGKKTNKENIRVKVVKDYLLIYEITNSEIVVLTIWDCRQNPEDLKRVLSV